jgi:LysM repeat protein
VNKNQRNKNNNRRKNNNQVNKNKYQVNKNQVKKNKNQGNKDKKPATTYVDTGNLSSNDYVPRVPAVCESGEILTVVLKGDTLDAIAKANGYDLQKLIDANPQFDDPDLIFPTDEVCVPADCKTGYTGDDEADTPAAPKSPDVAREAPSSSETHSTAVSTGDDISSDPALLQSSASFFAAFALVFAL